jgi:hypothetical protein
MSAVTAQRTFITYVDGVRTVVTEGAVYDSSDQLVKDHGDQFTTPESAMRTKPQAASRPKVDKT